MDEFLILLQAKLDEAKSKENLNGANGDIAKLQSQLDTLKVQAEIDPKTISELTRQLEGILNQKIMISDVSINSGNVVKDAQQTGRQIGNAINQGVTNATSKANKALKSFTDLRSFSELNKSISNFHVDTSELKNYKYILDDVKNTFAEFGQVKITNEIFKDGVLEKFKVNIEQVNGDLKETKSFIMALNDEKDAFVFSGLISGSESVVQHLDKTKNAVNQTAEAINALKEKAQIDKIQLSIDNGKGASEYQNRINSIIASLEKYGVETKEAQTITASLQSAFDSMKGMSGQELITQADKLEQEFKAVKVSVDEAKLAYDKLMQPASKEKITSTLLKVQKLLDNNTKVTENVKNEWQSYVNRLSTGSDIAVKDINDINLRLKETESNMRGMERLGLSWTDRLQQAWKKFGGWGFATGTMMTLVNQLRQIPKEVYEIDTAMTNLYKVTDETSSKYNQFLNSTSDSAHELGRSISSLVEQTANWAKLGFSLDEAEQLAKISSVYANVGEVNNDTAVSDIVTAMKAFNIEASDSITIVDSLNKLGNEFATDAASLGEGLSKSASALQLAGNDINETLAMLTGGTEITQNASEMGNALKVLSMRVRGMKGELEELGEEYENVESISKIQTQILNQTHGYVNIFDNNGNFKSTYEILKGISEIWSEISQVDQAALLETIAGKQRGNQVAALIQAFQSGQIEKAYEASANAAGSAMEEQNRWLESLEAKTQQFEAAFQSLSSTVLDSGLLKWFVDLGTSGIRAIDNIIDKFNILNTISTVGGGLLGAKGQG